MSQRMRFNLFFLLGPIALLLGAAGCESPPEPTLGALRASVATTGGDLDEDGYGLTVDAAQQQTVGLNATVVISGLPTGSHAVELSGVAANCTVSGGNPRPVTITSGDTAQVAFPVDCVATGVRVTTATTGIDMLDVYAVAVDGGPVAIVGASSTVIITRLSAGSHAVALAGVAPNCAVAGSSPRSVSITTGDIVPVTFAVTCVAATGSVEVTAVTSGDELDPDGYTVQVDNGPLRPLPVNGKATIEGLSAGDHSVRIDGVLASCTLAGANPRTVRVTTGGATRDTARTAFQVACVWRTGSVEVSAVTSGADLPPDDYWVQVDAGGSWQLAPNGTVTIEGVSGGDHSVRLYDVAGNCTIAGNNPRTVRVTTGGATRDTARTSFQVNCVATSGSVQVTTATTGTDLDPDGYSVCVDPYPDAEYGSLCEYEVSSAANGAVTISSLSPGNHIVWLLGVAGNCTIAGPNPRAVYVTTGATAEVAFQITCARVEVLVPYGASGYRWKVLADSTLPGGGFESPSFDDAGAGFSDGKAAFGHGSGEADFDCPLDNTVSTNWPLETDILLRRTFVLPAGAGNVKVSVAIDNDVQVFVNGVDITASGGTSSLVGGFQRHGGCAALDNFVFTAPNAIVYTGTNLVAIRARDRGVISFVDIRVTAEP